jgi:serine/threonine protein kinase
MTIASARGLIETLSHCRLLDAEQLAELNRTLSSRSDDALTLARDLLQRGWLTAYQLNQLFQGHASDLVLGHYLLLERLGEGGMGQVFKARERRLGRIVALKVLRKERIAKPDFVQRFYQEIQAAARLSHPNIVHAYDAEQIGEAHVFAMEYVEGIDLSRLVKQNGSLTVREACEYVRQAAVGLQHIHENGMVHRDIKPANLIRTQTGDALKILDMGLARLRHEEDEATPPKRLTRLGVVMGTIDFIAPEQALDSRQADIRSDLYSLGCTLYFLLAGRPPFPLEDPMAKLLAHSCDPATPLEQLRPEVPPSLSAIVNKLMAKRPGERYPTPAELIVDLVALAPPPTPVTAPKPSANDDPLAPFANLEARRVARVRRAYAPTTKRGVPLWIVALVLLSLLFLALLVYLV